MPLQWTGLPEVRWYGQSERLCVGLLLWLVMPYAILFRVVVLRPRLGQVLRSGTRQCEEPPYWIHLPERWWSALVGLLWMGRFLLREMVSVTSPNVDTYPVGSQTHRGASLEFWYQYVWHLSAQVLEDNAAAQYGVSRSMMYNGLQET
jgi:hypothetical protein